MPTAKYGRAYRAKWRAAGLCTRCGNPPVPGMLSCQACIDAGRQHRLHRKAAGKCSSCTHPAAPGRKTCLACLDKTRQSRRDRIAAGLCELKCGRPKSATSQKCDECRVKYAPKYRDRARQIREQVLAHYGSKCACCGESTPEFLQVDHVNNDGAEHRRQIGYENKTGGRGGFVGAGAHTYRWLIKNNFPEGFQLLCANCNCAKGFYGVCPHQRADAASPVCGPTGK